MNGIYFACRYSYVKKAQIPIGLCVLAMHQTVPALMSFSFIWDEFLCGSFGMKNRIVA